MLLVHWLLVIWLLVIWPDWKTKKLSVLGTDMSWIFPLWIFPLWLLIWPADQWPACQSASLPVCQLASLLPHLSASA
jgi:hypothetical protein